MERTAVMWEAGTLPSDRAPQTELWELGRLGWDLG